MVKRHIFFDKYAKTKRKLFILVLILTFVLMGAGLGILKLSNMKTINIGLETIFVDRVVPLQQLKLISDIYGIHIVDTTHKVLNGYLSWFEGRKRIDETAIKIPVIWNEYIKTSLVDEEKRLINELTLLFIPADNVIKKLRIILQSEDTKALAEFVKKDLYRNFEPVTDRLGSLFNMQVSIAKEVRDKEKFRYKISWNAGIASITLSFILSIIIVFQWKWLRALRDSF